MKIIGIAGAKRTGKDTLAAHIGEQARARRDDCILHAVAFADPIKRMILPLGYPAEILWGPSEGRNWIHPTYDVSARVLLQRIGTEVARQANPDFWVRAWCETVDALATGCFSYAPEKGLVASEGKDPSRILVVATDLRFANEHAELVRRGAFTVLVERVNPEAEDTHVSEHWCREAARQCVQRVVKNNGTLDDLAEQAKEIVDSVVSIRS